MKTGLEQQGALKRKRIIRKLLPGKQIARKPQSLQKLFQRLELKGNLEER